MVMVFGANPAGHLFGKRKLVVRGFGEADGKGVELFSSQGSGQGGDGTGIDAAAQQDTDLNIAAELVADGLLKELAGFFGRLIERAGADRIVLDRQVPKIICAAVLVIMAVVVIAVVVLAVVGVAGVDVLLVVIVVVVAV